MPHKWDRTVELVGLQTGRTDGVLVACTGIFTLT